MGNHSILNSDAVNISAEDTWQALVVPNLPDGIAVAEIHLSELLNKTERLDIILPLTEVLAPSGLVQETLALIGNRTSKIGLWADTSTTTDQLDSLLGLITGSNSSTDTKKDTADENHISLLRALDLIVLYTPLFADGRNFSLAKHLRLQGYQGEIRVAGEFGRDQIAYLRRSGIDSFVIANEYLAADIATAFSVLPTAYSGNDANQLPMFRSAPASRP
ncbi:DUF934 domain-containing protein [Psychrobacter pygoscelis]|uniref:DUF934 domain-containing protein n=1 Tax=Psychrobacter pygoscelis TaxID=2488563 RepID=UPI00103DA4D5|nr:DUF934 domain-containing protein [Psychrobacter pygoscelis]